MSHTALVFAVAGACLLAVVALALKAGKGTIYQRHAAIIGGLAGFTAGFGGCHGTDARPEELSLTLLAGAICALPGLAVGFFLGKKEP